MSKNNSLKGHNNAWWSEMVKSKTISVKKLSSQKQVKIMNDHTKIKKMKIIKLITIPQHLQT